MTASPGAVRQLFSAGAHQLLLMRIEVALARVQARAGIVPTEAAEAIAASATLEAVPLQAVAAMRARVGHPMVALLDAWNDALPDQAGEWLHFGATTQDIEDTALIIETRAAATSFLATLKGVEERLIALAEAHATTPAIGRTVGRHALPITFGLKVSRWAAESRRGMERIAHWLRRHDAGMLSGAVGTYASFAGDAFAQESAFLEELGLGQPWAADWKGSKDMFAEFGAAIAILATTWRRIAQDVFLLQGDDIGELEEVSDAVGSSTMPHKSNPRHCRRVIALSRTVAAHNHELLDWMVSLFERDQISSAATVGALCVAFEELMAAVEAMLACLRVDEDAMRRNLHRSGGIMAEHAMFLLAPALGKHTAHRLVREATQQAARDGLSLAQALCRSPELASAAATLDLDAELDPTRYLGRAPQVVARTVAQLRGTPVS